MQFDPAKCPACGADPEGTLETLEATAMLRYVESQGQWVWDGFTKMHWMTQKTVLTDGKVTLACSACRETWLATMTKGPGEVD